MFLDFYFMGFIHEKWKLDFQITWIINIFVA